MPLHPLIYLLALRLRAVPRNLIRSRSPKRIAMSILGLGLVLLWLAPSTLNLMVARPRSNPDGFYAVAPFVLLAFTLFNVLAARKGGLVFSPAEVDLLFPAPFTRRALLLYRLATGLASHLFFGVLLSIWFGRFAAIWPAALAAAILASIFVNLASVAAALIVLRLSAAATKRLPVLAAAVAAGFLLLVSAQAAPLIDLQDLRGTLTAVGKLPLVAPLLAPMRIFVNAFAAPDLSQLFTWLSAALALDAALLLTVIFLDADYLEAAASASERVAQRLQRARRGVWAGSAPTKARGRVPDLPFLAGAGPIIWFQLTRLCRHPGVLLLPVVVVLLPSFMLWQTTSNGNTQEAAAITSMLSVMIAFVSGALRFDFRADIDYLDRFRSLPISPFAMAAGQLAVPVAVLALTQLTLLAVACALAPIPPGLAVGIACFAPLLSAILLAIDNLIYLLAPARMPTSGFDMQAMGRQALLGLAKLLLLAIASLPVLLAVYLARLLTGSYIGAAAAAWLTLAVIGLALLAGVAAAFRRLDVSTDLAT